MSTTKMSLVISGAPLGSPPEVDIEEVCSDAMHDSVIGRLSSVLGKELTLPPIWM